MSRLTVFTPTYNRAYCLERAYSSLCRQSCADFEWLVIDDGSSDNTKSLIKVWQQENIITIRYIYQENQGMHGAHNTAFRNIDTELAVCLDSDDMFMDDAIESILSFWDKNKEYHHQVAGIIALDGTMDGDVLGSPFPEDMHIQHEGILREVNGVKGDKKVVYKTKLMQATPEYPVFPDEKYGSMAYRHQFIDARYPWLLLNKIVYLVEYQADGSTHNMYAQYRRSLKGWDIARRSSILHSFTFKRRFIESIHYVSNSIFLKKWSFICHSPRMFLTIAAIPFGIVLNLFVRYKTK